MAISAALAPAEEVAFADPRDIRCDSDVVMGVVISKPDKPLWPPPVSYNKLDLAQYLENVGPWMIERLKNGPARTIV